MAPVTRDAVWDAVLELATRRSEFRVRDVRQELEHDASDRTIRRTMAAMEDLGWLERDAPQAHYWRPGPRTRDRLGVASEDSAAGV